MPASTWTLEHVALAAADLGAWTWEIATDQVQWSPLVFELFGVSPEQFDGRMENLMKLVDERDRRRLAAQFERTLKQGPDEWIAEHRVAGSVPERWVSVRGRLIRDGQGNPVRMAGVIQDSSGLVAQREGRQQTELMQAVLDASLFAVLVLEPTGHIVYCNELAASLLGRAPSALRTLNHDSLEWRHTDLDGEPLPKERRPFWRVLATGKPVSGSEHRVELPGGRSGIFRVNAAPVCNEHGQIKLVVTSFEDITERRAIEEGFRQAQKLEAIGRLAGGVAHDFNNMLTAILSYASLAGRDIGDTRLVLDYLAGISETGERAAALTRQLLAFSRKDVTRPVKFDAREEIRGSARLIGRVLGEQVALTVEDFSEPCWVEMDRNQFSQMLVNLAVNARDAMPDGGKLTLSVARIQSLENPRVRIRVIDNGTGMDERTRRRAFEPFFTTRAPNERSGLGLAACHGIATGAGGTIAIESKLGVGTTVTLEFPNVSSSTGARLRTSGSFALPVGQGRILLVEDDAVVRAVALRSLRRGGFEVTAAADGETALALFDDAAFDLIVSDVILPGLSGPEVVAQARAKRPGQPALLVSGYAADQRVDQAEYLSKPYTPETLVTKVTELLTAARAKST